MKNLTIFFASGLLFVSLLACQQETKTPEPWNAGPIEQYSITPINGGATISYAIPDDPDILYIMAEYVRNGKTYTEKSSVHKNTLTIEGFNSTEPVHATLYKVNKHEQLSAPLAIEFTPLESLVSIAKESLKLKATFGGIYATWSNPAATELGIRLMANNKDKNDAMETQTVYFSSAEKGANAFRGFESEERRFAIAIEDKWGNSSDTVYLTTIPLFEKMIEKPYADFRSSIPYDNTSSLSGSYPFWKLWDNQGYVARNGWLTKSGASGRSFTIDLQKVAKLSRIITHSYHTEPYWQVNITGYELWGIDKIDYEKLKDKPYWLDEETVRKGGIPELDPLTELPEHTFKDDWQFLGLFFWPDYRKTPQEAVFGAHGAEFELPDEAEPVRYLRFIVRQVVMAEPAANNYFSMGEITLYGDDNF